MKRGGERELVGGGGGGATAVSAPVPAARVAAERIRSRRRRGWMRAVDVTVLALLVAADLAVPVFALVAHPDQWLSAIGLALGILAIGSWAGLYRRRFHNSVLDELPWILVAGAVGVGAAAVLPLLVGEPTPDRLRAVLLELAIALPLGRGLVYAGLRWWVGGHPARQTRVLVVGEDDRATQLIERIESHPGEGVVIAGAVADGEPATPEVEVLGGVSDLTDVVQRRRIDAVILTDASAPEWRLAHSLRRLPRRLKVLTVPAGYSLRLRGGRVSDQLWDIPVLPVTPGPLSGPGWWAKRAFDVVVAGTALLVLSPLLLVVALAVRLEIGRGVIFRQERIGRDGHPFVLYKFTSLKPTASREAETTWSIAHDDRVGPVGRFIRASSVDELPQLVNVLRGDMSIVGPRPERPHFVEQYADLYPGYEDRHRVPVGLTGYAAVNGLRGDTSISDRASFDNSYIDNWSMWEDVKIIVRTVRSVIGRHGR
ncbi:sugar transferase [Janibacter sp. UYMM211]|uniref:sugar transferase n=1 Tax=Janibacter sp. UYMM211 TaxID=3156342 RepID=UPI003398FDAC